MRIPITGDPVIDAQTIMWAKRLLRARSKVDLLKKSALRRISAKKQAFRYRIARFRVKMRRFWSKVTQKTPGPVF